MGDQFFIDVPYIRLPNPNHYVNDVNIELDILREQGKADIWYDSLDALDYNLEKGTWFISGLLSGDKEPNDCELNMPGLEITLAVALAANKKSTVTHPRRIARLQIAELIENVKGWSKARGILDNGVWYTQATKMYEEDGEGAMGVGKNKRHLIMDAVGDMIVVMVNLLELTGYDADVIRGMVQTVRDPSKAPELPKMSGPMLNHFLYHKMRKANTNAVDFLWDYGLQLQTKKLENSAFTGEDSLFIIGNLSECIYYANALSICYGFTLEEGLSLAWDEIKDRRGFLNSDGIFVKESDMVATDKIDELEKVN